MYSSSVISSELLSLANTDAANVCISNPWKGRVTIQFSSCSFTWTKFKCIYDHNGQHYPRKEDQALMISVGNDYLPRGYEFLLPWNVQLWAYPVHKCLWVNFCIVFHVYNANSGLIIRRFLTWTGVSIVVCMEVCMPSFIMAVSW